MSNASEIFSVNGLALRGYDLVAFFKLKKAVKGKKQFSCSHMDTEWWFCNEQHLQLFESDPQSYLPEYGGFCAFGASEGYKAAARMTAFTLFEGKLYFNFAHYVRERWFEKRHDKILMANKLWSKVQVTAPIKAHPIPIWWKYQLLKLVGKDLFE